MRKSILIVLFSAFALHIYSTPLSYIDSLEMKCAAAKEDTTRMVLLTTLAGAYNSMGYANYTALSSAQQALAIATKHNNIGTQVVAYLCMGKYFQLKGNTAQTLSYFLKAENTADKRNSKKLLGLVYDKLSQFYSVTMKNYPKALEYSQKDVLLMKEAGDKIGYAVALTNTGNIYFNIDSTQKALKYYTEAFGILSALNKEGSLATVENNIGSTYFALNDYDKAIDYYQKALSVYTQLNNTDGIVTCYENIGNTYDMKGDPTTGVTYSMQALKLAKKINSKEDIAYIYTILSEGYSKMGDYKKALEYQSALTSLQDTIYNEANAKQVYNMQVKYDTEKKDKENKILQLNVARQRDISYFISIGLILVLVLAFIIYRSYAGKKKANKELADKNKVIEEKNKDILDSINYAKTIQHAILTSDDYLEKALGNYFIVYKPRDVVSGDFYWCFTNGSKVIFTVADCTGHGVPGAFMSMIGNSLLNDIVIENNITDAAQILNNLRTNLLRTLQQKEQSSNITRDGMDIALCVWDKNQNTLQYAGANNPLYLIRNNTTNLIQNNGRVKLHDNNLCEFLPDKQPVGYYENKTNNPFSSHTIAIEKGDLFYISSDGYADQFSGETGKKYTKKRFREILASVSGMDLTEQKNILNKTLDLWKGSTLQTDDICLMGVRFS